MSNYEVRLARFGVPPGPGAGAGLQSSSPDALHSLMRVISKRRAWIIGAVIVCELMALAVTLLMRPTYQSTATIELNKQGSGIDLGLGDALSSSFSGNESLLTDLQTETAILRGDSLALDVIQQLKLASQPPFLSKAIEGPEKAEQGLPLEQAPATRTRLLAIFKGHLKVVPERGTRLIEVSFESHDQNQAAQVANQLVEAYKSNYRQTHYEATTETSGWLTTQLTDLKSNVEEAEKKLTDFEKANGILSFNMASPTVGLNKESMGGTGGYQTAEIHSPIIQKLDALNQELTEAEANRIGKEAIYRLTQTGNAEVVLGLQNEALATQSPSLVLTQGGGLSNLQFLRSQQSQLKVQLAQEANTYGANNRHLKDIEIQIRSFDEQINQELQLITKRAQADLQLAEQTEDEIRKRFDEQQTAASKLNDVAIQFAVLSDEAMSHKLLYEDLYTKLQEANISAGIKATNITVVSPARTESVPVRPQPVKYLALGILAGIILGLAAAYTVDTLDRTVNTPEEMEELTGRPVIGIIPDLMRSGKSYGAYFKRTINRSSEEEPGNSLQVWMLAHPDSVAAEAFRSLRTSIMLSRAGGGAKTILITSCVPGEGKTTITSNLAAAFAQHNKRVVIVEADMRRPRMMHVMEVPSEKGLSNVLTATASTSDSIIRSVQLPTLDILPAGPQPPNPSELLGSSAFSDLLASLRAQYDLVLLDSPPALLVADPASIASLADAVVWVSRAGVVTRPYLARAAGLIDRNQMPVIGFVINGVNSQEAGYGYGSYYMDKDEKNGKREKRSSRA